MSNPDRIRLVVLFGGRSAEHEVSCTTAAHVLRAVDPDRYEVVPVGITREGSWVSADAARAILDRGARDELPDRLDTTGTAVDRVKIMQPGDGSPPVVVLPLLHGPHGEDGTVQGLLEVIGVPYAGSGVLASALCMDKVKAKDVIGAHGLPQVPWVGLHDSQAASATAAVEAAGLSVPLFVKPANMGSSVGVTKVDALADLAGAIAEAAEYDEWIVIEQGLVGAREIEVAVLGNLEPRASVPGEIRASRDFYDYDDKYVTGASELIIPAQLDEATTAAARALALRAYAALRCEGMARVDLFLADSDSGLVINEVNTIPGFTPVSMYPKLWEASGLSYPALVDELIRLAVERHERRSRFSTKR